MIDSSEPSSISTVIQAKLGSDAIVIDMPTTDYSWTAYDNTLIGVERKAIYDLLGCIGDGTLADQLRRMVPAVGLPFLLIEGRWDVKDGYIRYYYLDKHGHETSELSAWTMHSAWDAVYAFQREFGINIIYSPELALTPHILINYYQWDQKPTHYSSMQAKKRDLKIPGPNAVALASIVGPDKAHRLLDHYGSLRSLFESDPSNINSVNGIGPSTIKKLTRVLDMPYGDPWK